MTDRIPWNPRREELLRRLWKEGKTASQIVEALGGVTRNAVVGKAHRLFLDRRSSPIRPLSEAERIRRAQKEAPKSMWTPELKAIVKAGYTPETAISTRSIAALCGCSIQAVYDEAARQGLKREGRVVTEFPILRVVNRSMKQIAKPDNCRDVSISELGSGDCRFPTSEDRPHRFCGLGTGGGVYCDFHHQIAHQKPLIEEREAA